MSAPADLSNSIDTYLPSLLLNRVEDHQGAIPLPSSETLSAAVLFADISGFTALAEEYARRQGTGAEELTEVLNAYFGRLIEHVSWWGGDVISFAGDALLAVWECDGSDKALAEAVRNASCCALRFQAQHGAETSCSLSLRTLVGAGTLKLMCLGGVLNRSVFLTVGDPLQQIALAIPDTEPGDVVLTAAAWSMVEDTSAGSHSSTWAVRVISMVEPADRIPVHRPQLPRNQLNLLGSYVPHAILRRLEARQTEWLGELRRVTILFVRLPELHARTPLPAAQSAILALQQALYRYEGSVNKLSVDEKGVALLAALGLPPLAHEDDAARGALAALSIHTAMRDMGWTCSVGVATGRVYCGIVGSPIRREYTLIGDTVNLAARLMTAAGDRVLCDEATRKDAGDSLTFHLQTPIRVKGKSRHIPVYCPLAGGVSGNSSLCGSQLVGRRREVQNFLSCLEDLQHRRQGGVLVVEGEPGIGKSRLIGEFLRIANDSRVTTLHGRGAAMESTTPYFGWRTIFEMARELDGSARDTDEWLQTIVAAEDGHRPLETVLPLLTSVLIQDFAEELDHSQMSGEVRANNTRDILTLVLKHLATRRPLLIVLEDLHWLDSASWALLRRVVHGVSPLLFVATTRPMPSPPFEYRELLERQGTSFLSLSALTDEETFELLREKFGVAELSRAIARFVQDKAGGNPFFTEQLAAALLESDQIAIAGNECRVVTGSGLLSDMGLPDSVQGVVISRIDRLPPGPQLTLKVASVIGQQFAFSTLCDVYPIPADRSDLSMHISRTQNADLIQREADGAPQHFAFKHAIARDVAYELMLSEHRRRLHRAIAEWYERTYAASLAPYLSVIANHWCRAHIDDKAVDALERAGEQARLNYANEEAVKCFSEALRISEKGEEGFDPVRRARWERQLAEAHYALGRSSECITHLRECLMLLRCPVPRWKWQQFLGTVYRVARQWLRRTPSASRPSQARDSDLEAALAFERLGEAHYLNNERLPCLYAVFAGVEAAERAGLSPELARSCGNSAIVWGVFAQHAKARAQAEHAQVIAAELGDPACSAWVNQVIGLYNVSVGNWAEAERVLQASIEAANQLGDNRRRAESTSILGLAMTYQGRFSEGIQLGRQLAHWAEQRGIAQEHVWGLCLQLEGLLADDSPQSHHRVAAMSETLERVLSADSLRSDRILRADLVWAWGLVAQAKWRIGQEASAALAAKITAESFAVSQPISYYILSGLGGWAEVEVSVWEQHTMRNRQSSRRVRIALKALRSFARMHPIGQPRSLFFQARVDWLSGRRSRAIRRLQQSIETATRLEMNHELGRSSSELARYTDQDLPPRISDSEPNAG